MANTAHPYTISVEDEKLKELSQRLSFAKFPDQLHASDGNNWAFGVPVDEMKRLVDYWKDGFDWRKTETELNKLPNFMTKIDVDGFGPLDIHFVHHVSPNKNAIPLLFCHGWPGSFIESKKLITLLQNNGDDQPDFHIIAPSLPNFGFSEGVNRKGFTLDKYAETLYKLMLHLGYDSWVTQAGDWGVGIVRALNKLHPDHCHALTPYTEREKRGLERSDWFRKEGFGYNLLQSTKPQTVGYALADSPVTLLAWIYEKLHDWTDDYPWTDDEILTWVSIYWFSTAGPEASVRIYHEATHPEPQSSFSTNALREWVPKVKLGIAHFPREIVVVPRTWAATLGPVVYQSDHDKGGHFAAWEQPEAVVSDLQNMFGKSGPCYGIVAGKNGF